MRSKAAPALILTLLPLLVYGRFILGDELYNPDVFLAYRPAHAWLADGLRHGHVPLWTAAILGGFPIAFSEYGWFSPLTILPLALLGGHAGYYAAVALSVALAGLAAYALARQQRSSRACALLAGLVYGQSLFVVGGAPLLNQGAAYWALPAALWCVEAAIARQPLAAPALGLVIALTLLGSHPQLAIIVLTPPAICAAWHIVRFRRWDTALPLGSAALIGALVSALRFLPTLPLLAASERSGGLTLDASAIGSVAPHALLAGLIAPSLTVPRFLAPQWSLYVGALPVALALAARRRASAGWWLLVVAGLVLSLGSLTPVFWALQRTPLLAYFREPSRFLLWTVLGIAVLAARGLERIATQRPDRRLAAVVRVTSFAVLPTVIAVGATYALRVVEPRAVEFLYLNTVRQVTVRDYPQEHYFALASGAWHTVVRSFDPLDIGMLVPLASMASAALWWAIWRGRGRAVAGALLCTAIPLLAYGQVRLPAIPRNVVAERPTAVEPPTESVPAPRLMSWLPLAADFENRTLLAGADLDANVPSYRLLKRLLAPNFGLAYGTPQLDGYENLMTREQAVLTAALGSERTSTTSELALTRQRLPERRRLGGERWGLVEAAGVGTVLSVERIQPSFWPAASRYEPAAVRAERGVPSVTAFRLTHPSPRAYVAPSWRVAETADGAVRMLSTDEVDGLPATVITLANADFATGALLRPGPGSVGRNSSGPPATAEITRYEERLVEVIATADGDALLVLLDAMTPGWTATVTGASVPIFTANVAFRAVPIPAGRHVVRFEYSPPGWELGLAISGASAFVLATWLIWSSGLLAGRRIRSTSITNVVPA
jgi:hypothetical protein